jgi:hypothetical protein
MENYQDMQRKLKEQQDIRDGIEQADSPDIISDLKNHIPTEKDIAKINEGVDTLTQNPNSQVNSIEDLLSRYKMSKEQGRDSLLDLQSKNPSEVINQYLAGKIKSNVPEKTNYAAEMEKANEKLANPGQEYRQELLKTIGNDPKDWTTMGGESYNPNLPQKYTVDPKKMDYSVLGNFDPMGDIQNAVENKYPSGVLTPNQLSNLPEPIPTVKQDTVSRKTSSTEKNKGSTSGNTGNLGNKPDNSPKELDPLEQYKAMMKLEDERQQAGKDELANALQQRDMTNAIAQISRGISQAGAAYGGGSLTQLKADTTGADALEKTGEQRVNDIKEKMKNATESEKRILEKQLTLAQMQKLRDDKANDKAKLGIEERKLGLEQQKINIDKAKSEAETKRKSLVLNLTKAQETADKDYAKKYTQWATAGGRETLQSKLDELADVKKQLLKGDIMTSGPIVGNMPRVLAPEAAAITDKMNSIIVDTLRPTLGAQFTAQEGEAIKKLSYDPQMEQKYNIPKIDILMKKLADKIQANDKLANEYENTGTISHLKPINDSNREKSNTLTPEQEALQWVKDNPNDPRAKQILLKLRK